MQFILFFVSLTLSALLFAVQPMASKMLLPILGGTPAVWTTAMFTFQLLLLGGYFYAHVLVRWLRPNIACFVHGALFLASLRLLPIAVQLKTDAALLASPAPYVIAALAVQLGLPFLLLSATQPLLQAWLAGSRHKLSAHPHVLYSASNLGSFIGLIGYVVVAEPMLTLTQQRMGWSIAYALGLVLMLFAGAWLSRHATPTVTTRSTPAGKITWQRMVGWIGLAFLVSSLSLGVTSYVTTDVASMPLLWVIPLALYLLSFVDAFRLNPQLVPFCQRYAPLIGVGALLLYALQMHQFAPVFLYHFVAFGVLAIALHGWLAAARPQASDLTWFYLCMSLGGALGGLANGIIAPLLLRDAYEYPVMLMIACLTSLLMRTDTRQGDGYMRQLQKLARVITFVFCATAGSYVVMHSLTTPAAPGLDTEILVRAAGIAGFASLILFRSYLQAYYTLLALIIIRLMAVSYGSDDQQLRFKDRNFFGVERVMDNPEQEARYLAHDTTVHGVQSTRAEDRLQVLSYYPALKELFVHLPRLHSQRLATVGLGVGSTKCYLRPKQWMDFYEINPMVQQLAEDRKYFTLLSDCPGEHQVLLGDGRIKLGEQKDGTYGMIVLDAFSSDAIPAHLLTQEALRLYFSKLAPHGILMMHTTNRHIDLWPVIGAHADALGYVAYGKHFTYKETDRLKFRSFWVVMARDASDIHSLVTNEKDWRQIHGEGGHVWTDQYVSILPYLKVIHGDSAVNPKP